MTPEQRERLERDERGFFAYQNRGLAGWTLDKAQEKNPAWGSKLGATLVLGFFLF